jgi:hypothetical protein
MTGTMANLLRCTDIASANLITSCAIGAAGASLVTWLLPNLSFWPWFLLMSAQTFVLARIYADGPLGRGAGLRNQPGEA